MAPPSTASRPVSLPLRVPGWSSAWLLRSLVVLGVAILLAGTASRVVVADTVTDGTRTLTVSKTVNLDPNGESVAVSGSGYDESKGIYIALCVIPPAGQLPSPCGGGANLGGEGANSFWISSDPPSYAENLAIPYGPGGSFSVNLAVGPLIGTTHDCRVVACAVVTRSDHVRLNDRSQDILVPVSFGVPPTPTPVATSTVAASASPSRATPSATASAVATAASTQTPTATAAGKAMATPTPTSLPRATAGLSDDGRTATAGDLSLSVSQNDDIQAGDTVTVSGRGFRESEGIYVALCRLADPGTAPGPCASGSADVTVWLTSNPPDYANGKAHAYGPGGSFEVELVLNPVIDGDTDCRDVACGVTTRSDDRAPGDRSQDLVVPVTFSNGMSSDVTAGPQDQATGTQPGASSSGTPLWVWLVAPAVAIGAIGAVVVLVIRRRAIAGIATLLLFLISACGTSAAGDVVPSATPTGELPVTVRSAEGREVVVTSNTRIVSLWGNVTEVLFALGLGDNVVGRDVTSTEPAAAAALPEVTRAHDVSAEGVLALNPTLVLGSLQNSGPEGSLDQIRNVGIPVVLFDDPASVEEIIPRIREIARTVGVPERGEELATDTQERLAAVEQAIPAGFDRPTVAFLYMRGQAGIYLIAGPGSGADSMIEAAGGTDAGSAMGLEYPFTPITSEALAEAAPDIILLTTTGLESVGGVEGLVGIPGIAQTPAGRERHIITMDDGLLFSFGPRTPAAIEELSAAIHQWAGANQ